MPDGIERILETRAESPVTLPAQDPVPTASWAYPYTYRYA
jgi:hypothetical protein